MRRTFFRLTSFPLVPLSSRGLAAGLGKGQSEGDSLIPNFSPAIHPSPHRDAFLVVGDNCSALFAALCLRYHDIPCDLLFHSAPLVCGKAHAPWKGSIMLTPAMTEILGERFNLVLPYGSISTRLLTFDHVGNDLSDLPLQVGSSILNSPITSPFFTTDRRRLEVSLLGLCETGPWKSRILFQHIIPRSGGLEALENGHTRVSFTNGMSRTYLGVLATGEARHHVPILSTSPEELIQRNEDDLSYKNTEVLYLPRWLEVHVPELPPLKHEEKRFTPTSQEVIEILTSYGSRMIVRGSEVGGRTHYYASISLPTEITQAEDPRQPGGNRATFWTDVEKHWHSYHANTIGHTLFRPLLAHMKKHFSSRNTYFRSDRLFLANQWDGAGGRILRLGEASYGHYFDPFDLSDSQGFADCVAIASAISNGENISQVLEKRKQQVLEEQTIQRQLINLHAEPRGQLGYMLSRFKIKFLGKYTKLWQKILKNHLSFLPIEEESLASKKK